MFIRNMRGDHTWYAFLSYNVDLASIGIAKDAIVVWNLAGKTTTDTTFDFGLKRSLVLLRHCGIECIRPCCSRLLEAGLNCNIKVC